MEQFLAANLEVGPLYQSVAGWGSLVVPDRIVKRQRSNYLTSPSQSSYIQLHIQFHPEKIDIPIVRGSREGTSAV